MLSLILLIQFILYAICCYFYTILRFIKLVSCIRHKYLGQRPISWGHLRVDVPDIKPSAWINKTARNGKWFKGVFVFDGPLPAFKWKILLGSAQQGILDLIDDL